MQNLVHKYKEEKRMTQNNRQQAMNQEEIMDCISNFCFKMKESCLAGKTKITKLSWTVKGGIYLYDEKSKHQITCQDVRSEETGEIIECLQELQKIDKQVLEDGLKKMNFEVEYQGSTRCVLIDPSNL